MNPHRLRVFFGLFAALLAATLLKFTFFDIHRATTSDHAAPALSLMSSLGFIFLYVLPLAAVAVIASEIICVRKLAIHLALGNAVALMAAYFATHSETLTSPVYSGGALTFVFLLAAGSLPALLYWIIAGRHAGWKGDVAERADTMAAQAFTNASENTHVDYCMHCLLGWSALGLLLFALLGWVSVDSSGLRDWLTTETEHQGKVVLKSAGFEWATFKVEGDRGVIEGLAPDEVQKRAAYDSVREALASAIGFPGVVAQIDNHTVAKMQSSAAVTQQIAEAARRESEAKEAVEAARAATLAATAAAEAARAAQAEAKSMADQRALAAEAELKRRIEDEKVRAAEEALRKAAELSAKAAEPPPAPPPAQPVAAAPAPAPAAAQTAAVEANAREDAVASLDASQEAANDNNSASPALEQAPRRSVETCSSQDLAILESSRILFERQMFEISANFDAELDRLAASAQACAPRPVLVAGWAGSNADSVFNPSLGLQRAEAVREKLVARGVPTGRIVAQSSGSSAPIDNDHTTEDERALSRRAEFRLLEVSELSRDATLGPDERASTCESDLTGIMTQSIIYFPMGSARIGDESFALIKKLATAIQTCGSVIVTVEGHTDKLGGANYNQGLSEQRAKAVRDALAASGADQTRLAARGFASSRPHDTADTAEAFALNRRIEFKVSGKFAANATRGP